MTYQDNRAMTEVAESMRESGKDSKDSIRILDALWFEERNIPLPLLTTNWLDSPEVKTNKMEEVK